MKEKYRAIKGFEGIYEVSDFGNVRSLDRVNHLGTERNGKILKGSLNCGYLRVCLCKNGKSSIEKIHKLVAIAFLNHVPNGHVAVIDHIDNNPLNNNLSNLHIVTTRENIVKDTARGTSQHVGVYWYKRDKKWVARIYIDGKNKHLGRFDDELEASNAYQKELKKFLQKSL